MIITVRNIKSLFSYLFLHFVFALAIIFLGRVFIFLWNSLSEAKNVQILFSVILWVSVIIIIGYLLLKRLSINPKKFLGFCLINALLSIFFIALLWLIIRPHHNLPITKNYVGIFGLEDYEDDEGGYSSHKYLTYVFKKEDLRIKKQIEVVEEEYQDAVKEEYIFWQTALASGYNPKYIKQYDSEKGPSSIELLITVGPLVLAECFLSILLLSVYYLIIPLVLFLLKKPFLFKDFSSFKEAISKQPT